MDAQSVKFKLDMPVLARYIQHQIASPFVVTVLWLVINNVIMKIKQDVTNAESFLDTNALEESARNQAALSHVEMVSKHLLKPATMATSQAAHRIASKTKDINALLYLVRLLNVVQYVEMKLWSAMRRAITE